MTTVFINDKSRTGRKILKYIEQHPRVAQIINERDNTPLPVPEDELVSLEEFKTRMETLARERLNLNITL